MIYIYATTAASVPTTMEEKMVERIPPIDSSLFSFLLVAVVVAADMPFAKFLFSILTKYKSLSISLPYLISMLMPFYDENTTMLYFAGKVNIFQKLG